MPFMTAISHCRLLEKDKKIAGVGCGVGEFHLPYSASFPAIGVDIPIRSAPATSAWRNTCNRIIRRIRPTGSACCTAGWCRSTSTPGRTTGPTVPTVRRCATAGATTAATERPRT
jgi:hypothetical protein